jgi:hypothetical protein
MCVTSDIPTDLPNDAYISIDRNTPLKIHSVGFQPAKSIPEIPRWFVRKYTAPSDIILEPFSGSGTTIVESLLLGRRVYWLDYQPLSRLICRVKTTHVLPALVQNEVRTILKQATKLQTAPENVTFRNRDFWFQQPVRVALEILREQITEANDGCQPALWLAFAATVRKCSDMNDSMILAARRSNVQEVPRRDRQDVYGYFNHYSLKIVEALDEWQQVSAWNTDSVQELPCEDARTLDGNWYCNAVMTSPPYINAIDYVWAAKFELHWLGLVKDDDDRLRLYTNEIGTERILASVCRELGRTGNSELDCLIQDIYEGNHYKASKGQNHLRARVVYKYFVDMKEHFVRSFQKLRTGGHYCFAIGDVSKICGVDVPVASLLTDLATEIGFCEVFKFHLLLKNRRLNVPRNVKWANTIKHDTVVVLKKV